MNIHILVLIIAIALFGVLAFKQMSALILAPLVTIFVIDHSRNYPGHSEFLRN